ncbi:MAG: hypothetical protein NZ840_13265 [Anaerolineales bacterium]|nr:hypothetical protein [Anaerolineales bacterium]MDW8163004.1 hypothetical protein [Anaerolineales bacterium]
MCGETPHVPYAATAGFGVLTCAGGLGLDDAKANPALCRAFGTMSMEELWSGVPPILIGWFDYPEEPYHTRQ